MGLVPEKRIPTRRELADRWRDHQAVSAFERVFVAALRNMENLRELDVRDASRRPPNVEWNCFPLIRKCRLPSLASLTFNDMVLNRSYEPVPDVLPLIHDHPLLEYLELPEDYRNLPFLPNDITHLKSLNATVTDARMILPGRPVRSLILNDLPSPLFSEAWRDLGSSEGPLLRVTLPFSRNPTNLISGLSAMGDHLKHLKSLVLSTVFFRMWEAVKVALSAFTQLQDLEIDIVYEYGCPETDVWDNLEHVCTGLERFHIHRRTATLRFR
ncbi:hypothetical protein FRB94_009852 [Tulasnella sp. JGI-2019a]|nr:hypothetical protein FRB93_013762 [Tulasnella sp. JGI-2019a]KAG9010771.1 hypothetical protein FRB94_009852 [Tulasnella sp. JGI-2019a]KAG9026179.1 hypothetical protein FRB95_009321 [Tulasnella sp. JGI-2019a]